MTRSIIDKGTPDHDRPNIWGMMRDVLIASLNKGQFLIAILAVIFIAFIWRLPQADLSKLAFEILAMLKTGWIYGWVLFLITFIASVYRSRSANTRFKIQTDELTKKILDPSSKSKK